MGTPRRCDPAPNARPQRGVAVPRLLVALGTLVLPSMAWAQIELARVSDGSIDLGFGHAADAYGDRDGDGRDEILLGVFRGQPVPYVAVYDVARDSPVLLIPGPIDTAFGHSVAGIGDISGDGVPDILAGSPNESTPTGQLSGRAYALSGSDGSTLFTLDGLATGDRFGWNVAGAGDMDGDGVGELIVANLGNATLDPEYVRVYSGATGSLLHHLAKHPGSDGFGSAIAGLSDVNADGWADIAVGARATDTSALQSGAVFVYSGLDGSLLFRVLGEAPFEFFGWSLCSAGDITGDGRDELWVGAGYLDGPLGIKQGRASLHSGLDGSKLFEVFGKDAEEVFGADVACPGDVNGDGVSDLCVGALRGGAEGSGYWEVYDGANHALLQRMDRERALGDDSHILCSPAGDSNGDGLQEVIFGSNATHSPGVLIVSGCFHQPAPESYCTAKVNSLGCRPRLSSTGGPTLTAFADDFLLVADDVLEGVPGVALVSTVPQAVPFQGGWLCVGAPAQRLTAFPSTTHGTPPGTVCKGRFLAHVPQIWMQSSGVAPGTNLYAQLLSRDPGLPPATALSLTDALRFTVCD